MKRVFAKIGEYWKLKRNGYLAKIVDVKFDSKNMEKLVIDGEIYVAFMDEIIDIKIKLYKCGYVRVEIEEISDVRKSVAKDVISKIEDVIVNYIRENFESFKVYKDDELLLLEVSGVREVFKCHSLEEIKAISEHMINDLAKRVSKRLL